jgi:hypothetical membrane protein
VFPTRTGILLFSAAVLAGPLYTVDGYSVVQNVVSELGAQNTKNSSVMVAGFLALGVGLAVDGARRFQWPALPFVAFGVFMALAGLFAHKPLAPGVPFNEATHIAHSVLASMAGVAVTVGLLWHGVRTRGTWRRGSAMALGALCVMLPLGMLAMPQYQGLIQRVMYLLVFAWLWACFPGLHKAKTSNLRNRGANRARGRFFTPDDQPRRACRVAVPCGWSCSRKLQRHASRPLCSSHVRGAVQRHLREMCKRQGTDARCACQIMACFLRA